MAMQHLRGHFGPESDAILNRGYTCWLGSGISLTCFPGLKDLLRELLDILHGRSNIADPACPWKQCLAKIQHLIHEDLDDVRIVGGPSAWPDIDSILRRLVDRYADVLDHTVRDGGTILSVPWDILKLDERYADATVKADTDHRLIALLMA